MPVLHLGDCAEVMAGMEADSVDSIVTDPPYGLSFMGKKWDYDVPSQEIWEQCLRVLKPGGHLLAFAGTRTQHRMAVRIEDAGFEIRDMIAWVYGSGFPKSLDVSKAIDAQALTGRSNSTALSESEKNRPVVGTARRVVSKGRRAGEGTGEHGVPANMERWLNYEQANISVTAPATDAARQWAGWGTALKPALEPITVARKPLGSTVAECVLAHGTGAINVDGCRVEADGEKTGWGGAAGFKEWGSGLSKDQEERPTSGRWPANLIHDGQEPADLLGDAARFFYCAKASKRDRDEGNIHPTVKPTDLMRYLCRLVTPPGGMVLDPFMGSGSTGKAAALEGFGFTGIERDPDYIKIAQARIAVV